MNTLWPLWWRFINFPVKCLSLFSSQTVQTIISTIKTILSQSEQCYINVSYWAEWSLLLCDYCVHSFVGCHITLDEVQINSLAIFHLCLTAKEKRKLMSSESFNVDWE